MTPALKLFDPQIERMFVAALIADPTWHDQVEACLPDLGDLQAQAAFTAFANVRARGATVTAAAVRAELAATLQQRDPSHTVLEHEHLGDLGWFDKLVAVPLPTAPPVAGWSHAIVNLAEYRRQAIADAEPKPEPARRAPSGPRSTNEEPVRLAEAFRAYRYELGGEPTLVRWARAWWRYDGTRYREHDDEALDRDLIGFLDVVRVPKRSKVDNTTSLERVTSKKKTIGEIRTALFYVMPGIDATSPHWTSDEEGDPDANQLTACANGILNLETLELLPRTPRLFTTTAISAPWEPEGPPPTAWLEFLHSLWGDDTESVWALRQMFGYLLTADTSQQKMFALIGPPRCGKGTIARILKALLGDDAVVNPTIASLETQFGLAPLVGKTVAIIGDARLGGQADQAQVVERLLSISGEDPLSINRKNRDAINVRLRTRVLLLSNELPRLYDTSGALASRFLILSLNRSFLGKEDTCLEAKLLAEMPGIFRWAVQGRQDLAEQGKFTTPASSNAAIALLRASSSPLSVFVEECCEVSPDRSIDVDALWARYMEWSKDNGRDRPGNKQSFGRDLHTLLPEVETKQNWVPGTTKRVRSYQGINLR